MDAIELLEYGLLILEGKAENDLDKKDLHIMRNMLHKLICNYLREEEKDYTIIKKMYCEVCRCKTFHRIMNSGGDRVCECEFCNNMEVI